MISPKVIYGGHPESPEAVRARVLDVLAGLSEPILPRALNVLVMGTDKFGRGATGAACGWLRVEGFASKQRAGYSITDRGRAARDERKVLA